MHHTYTNILGKDKDLGYEIMRIDPHQKWHPVYLLQPFYNTLLMAFFEWGVAFHDLDLEAMHKGEKSKGELAASSRGSRARPGARSSRTTSPSRRFGAGRRKRAQERRSAANFTANIVRNVWSHSIIFCGHFPDQTYTFTQEETEDESRGAFYVRQLLGAANIEGSPLFHVISGNLGYQVEHHLYPDMPSTRYGEIAPRVKDICERYELPYNTGPFRKQLVHGAPHDCRLAFPGGKPRPKPGPYKRRERRRAERRRATQNGANPAARIQRRRERLRPCSRRRPVTAADLRPLRAHRR